MNLITINTWVAISIFGGGIVAGIMLGWFAHKIYIKKESKSRISDQARIGYIIVFVWSLSVIAQISITDYETPLAIHGIMGLVAGYFFQQKLADAIKSITNK